MSTITELREKIFETTEAKWLVVKVHTDRLDSHDYRVSASQFINDIFPDWENDSRIHFLAIEIRGDRTFMAIDINNSKYDFDTAHETKIILPVHIVWQHKRRGWFLVRWPREDEPLAAKIAHLHDLNGFDATTPFLANYNERVMYENPRYRSPVSTATTPHGGPA
ncbi:hypothetical protein BO71DRAFT_394623 [Aspergillus terreus]|uniref:Uncharacterized protein n=1 Tax=Aspergillus terreus TaxID=33178 RepID=A0A5M3ZHA0_ASPTE|nr:hypothetical protein ATETN484_0017012700 [Aspergillus terreus]GFF21798.1 hypothetical protein BO71DRAFT_394623 [Aspergillus terreus]